MTLNERFNLYLEGELSDQETPLLLKELVEFVVRKIGMGEGYQALAEDIVMDTLAYLRQNPPSLPFSITHYLSKAVRSHMHDHRRDVARTDDGEVEIAIDGVDDEELDKLLLSLETVTGTSFHAELKVLAVLSHTTGCATLMSRPRCRLPIRLRALACLLYSIGRDTVRIGTSPIEARINALRFLADSIQDDEERLALFAIMDPASIKRLSLFFQNPSGSITLPIPAILGATGSDSPSALRIVTYMLSKVYWEIDRLTERIKDASLQQLIYALSAIKHIVSIADRLVNRTGRIRKILSSRGGHSGV